MRVHSGISWVVGYLVLGGCTGNAADRSDADSTLPVAASVSPDRSNVSAAERVLREYLDASRETSLDPDVLNALTACGDGGQSFFPTTLLAGYTLLPFEMRGDTVIGRAEVVTVAEQDVDRREDGRFQARQRIRSDVLEWDIVPLEPGAWVVCNGLRFGYTGADSLTTWRPEGASYATARRLADSIMAVRP